MPAGDGSHWWLLVVNHHSKEFHVYNSIPGIDKYKAELSKVARNLEFCRPNAIRTAEACAERGDQWHTHYGKTVLKQPSGSVDCGLYTVYFMEQLLTAKGGEPHLLKKGSIPAMWREKIKAGLMGMYLSQREMERAGFIEGEKAGPSGAHNDIVEVGAQPVSKQEATGEGEFVQEKGKPDLQLTVKQEEDEKHNVQKESVGGSQPEDMGGEKRKKLTASQPWLTC